MKANQTPTCLHIITRELERLSEKPGHYQAIFGLALESITELVTALERIANDIILDRQDIEYYKRLHLIHKDWARAALAKAKE